MNNSTTPETDARQSLDGMAHDHLWRDFARKLERERYELAQRLDFQEKMSREYIDMHTKLQCERDEAREELIEMTLRWERTNDALFNERARADRLASALGPIAWLAGNGKPNVAEQALAAWRDARK